MRCSIIFYGLLAPILGVVSPSIGTTLLSLSFTHSFTPSFTHSLIQYIYNMDQLNNAVASYVKQVEEAIDSGLSYKQFIRVTQRVEASVLLHLGDSALDHFVHKKFRDELTMHTVRLYDECKRRYSGRCWSAQQEIFEGSDDVRNGVFHNVTKYTTDPLCVENDWDIWCEKYLISCGQTMEDLEEESKVLLNVFKKSATHLVVSVKADCQQQVDLFKKALAKTNEHLDQSSLDIIKLQGVCVCVCV